MKKNRPEESVKGKLIEAMREVCTARRLALTLLPLIDGERDAFPSEKAYLSVRHLAEPLYWNLSRAASFLKGAGVSEVEVFESHEPSNISETTEKIMELTKSAKKRVTKAIKTAIATYNFRSEKTFRAIAFINDAAWSLLILEQLLNRLIKAMEKKHPSN